MCKTGPAQATEEGESTLLAEAFHFSAYYIMTCFDVPCSISAAPK